MFTNETHLIEPAHALLNCHVDFFASHFRDQTENKGFFASANERQKSLWIEDHQAGEENTQVCTNLSSSCDLKEGKRERDFYATIKF